jgi:hypothetical protein
VSRGKRHDEFHNGRPNNKNDACSEANNAAIKSRSESCSLSQQIYINSGYHEKKVLFLFNGSLNHNNKPLFLFEQAQSWSLLPKDFLRPHNDDSVHKINGVQICLTSIMSHVQVTGLLGSRKWTGLNKSQFTMKWTFKS